MMDGKIFVTAQFYLHGLSVDGNVTTRTIYWHCNEPVLMVCVCIIIYQLILFVFGRCCVKFSTPTGNLLII
jgi:hypothetical protein